MKLLETPSNIRPLDHEHDRAAFSCGDERLDKYLTTVASDSMRRRLAVVWVWTIPPSQAVQGYYTLTSTQIDAGPLPADVIRKYKLKPGMPVPVTLLGRFAIHRALQRQGAGEMLCLDALFKSLQAAATVASAGVILDARTDVAKRFWTKREFVSLGVDNHGVEKFFLPMSYIEDLFD